MAGRSDALAGRLLAPVHDGHVPRQLLAVRGDARGRRDRRGHPQGRREGREHLQSPDFFDAERTPEIRLEATDIRRRGDEVVAQGELTIRGVTKPVELRGTATDALVDGFGRERIGLELETEIDRTDFGLSWNMPLPTGEPALPHDVKLNAELYFVKA